MFGEVSVRFRVDEITANGDVMPSRRSDISPTSGFVTIENGVTEAVRISLHFIKQKNLTPISITQIITFLIESIYCRFLNYVRSRMNFRSLIGDTELLFSILSKEPLLLQVKQHVKLSSAKTIPHSVIFVYTLMGLG